MDTHVDTIEHGYVKYSLITSMRVKKSDGARDLFLRMRRLDPYAFLFGASVRV